MKNNILFCFRDIKKELNFFQTWEFEYLFKFKQLRYSPEYRSYPPMNVIKFGKRNFTIKKNRDGSTKIVFLQTIYYFILKRVRYYLHLLFLSLPRLRASTL